MIISRKAALSLTVLFSTFVFSGRSEERQAVNRNYSTVRSSGAQRRLFFNVYERGEGKGGNRDDDEGK